MYSMKTGQYRGLEQKERRGKEDATKEVDRKATASEGRTGQKKR
jgi:hypothetical protein